MNIVEQIKERLKVEFSEAAEQLKLAFAALKKLKIAQAVILVYETVSGLVLAVEEIAHDLGEVSGADKKKALIEFLNEAIDIPYVPEFVEAWIFGFAVDTAVGKFNLLYQKSWFKGGIERGRTYFALVKGALEVESA